MNQARRAGQLALPACLAVVALLALMGFSVQLHASESRALLSRLLARRLTCVVGSSAFEEACARLEHRYRDLPLPFANLHRQLKTELAGWRDDMEVSVPLTRADCAGTGVSVTDVRVRSSDWLVQADVDAERRTGVIREIALIELSAKVTVRSGSRDVVQTVSSRRYMSADGVSGELRARLRIQPTDMVVLLDSGDRPGR